MLSYQRGALSGSAVYAATSPTGRAMSISVDTSTIPDPDPPPRAAGSAQPSTGVTVDPGRSGIRSDDQDEPALADVHDLQPESCHARPEPLDRGVEGAHPARAAGPPG